MASASGLDDGLLGGFESRFATVSHRRGRPGVRRELVPACEGVVALLRGGHSALTGHAGEGGAISVRGVYVCCVFTILSLHRRTNSSK